MKRDHFDVLRHHIYQNNRLGRCHAMSKCRLLIVAWKQTNALWCYNSPATFFAIKSTNVVRPSKAITEKHCQSYADQLATTLFANFSLIPKPFTVCLWHAWARSRHNRPMDSSSNGRGSGLMYFANLYSNPMKYTFCCEETKWKPQNSACGV